MSFALPNGVDIGYSDNAGDIYFWVRLSLYPISQYPLSMYPIMAI